MASASINPMIDKTRYRQGSYRIEFLNQRLEPEMVTVYADESDQAVDITYKTNKRVVRITNVTKLT